MRKIVLVACCCVLLAGCGEDRKAGRQAVGAAEVMVHNMTAERVLFSTELMGRVRSYRVAEVRPQVGGIIQERLFEEGADVKAGDVLYQINADLYKADYENAKANLAIAEANLAPAKIKMERFRDLVNANAVSRQEYEDALASFKQAQATIGARKAALDTARIHLENTRVTAPISGRIGRSAVTAGALVTANQAQMLTSVQQLRSVYVDLTQSSAELLRLRKSLESGRLQQVDEEHAAVSLYLEDGTLYSEQGILQFTDVTVDESTGAVNMQAVFPNPRLTLLPGMYVRAVFSEGKDDNALLLPQRSLLRDASGAAFTWVIKEDSTAERRPIEVGRTHGNAWIVLSGLNSGERVVTEGIQKLRPGAKVVISEAVPNKNQGSAD